MPKASKSTTVPVRVKEESEAAPYRELNVVTGFLQF
jgi:hypothetical protein